MRFLTHMLKVGAMFWSGLTVHWVIVYEHCQGGVLQERRGALVFKLWPVALSFHVDLSWSSLRWFACARLMQSVAFLLHRVHQSCLVVCLRLKLPMMVPTEPS